MGFNNTDTRLSNLNTNQLTNSKNNGYQRLDVKVHLGSQAILGVKKLDKIKIELLRKEISSLKQAWVHIRNQKMGLGGTHYQSAVW